MLASMQNHGKGLSAKEDLTTSTVSTNLMHYALRLPAANNSRLNANPLHFVEKCKSSSSSRGYIGSLLQRFKRLAQPRILHVRASSSHSGMGTGYRRKDLRLGMGAKCYYLFRLVHTHKFITFIHPHAPFCVVVSFYIAILLVFFMFARISCILLYTCMYCSYSDVAY